MKTLKILKCIVKSEMNYMERMEYILISYVLHMRQFIISHLSCDNLCRNVNRAGENFCWSRGRSIPGLLYLHLFA